jgi:putative endonuclease
MYYVYIIQSVLDPCQTYIGCTENLEKRLSNHNAGTTYHTEKHRPWKLMVHIVFDNKEVAYEFETYLKSGSGRAFVAKRLWRSSTMMVK